MKLEIDIPERHYNNIMAIDSINLGRVPYKGIIMYSINAIKHGKVLEQEPKSEWQKDHEILKAYSDGANEVLGKIRDQLKSNLRGVEIALEVLVENDPLRPKMEGAKSTLEDCLELIDKVENEESDADSN